MTARVWRRVGWGFSFAAVVGIAAYMLMVGWGRASLIAGVGAFFVAIAGLAVAVRPAASRGQGGVQMRIRNARAEGIITQEADAPAGILVQAEIDDVTARHVWQSIRADARSVGAADEDGRDD
jgi:uncharacterized protein (DUF58 family)